MGAAVPIITAVAPLVGSVASAVFAPKAPEPAALPAPPAPPAPVDNVEPEGVLDNEAARIRALKRRRENSTGFLQVSDDSNVTRPTLLGD